LYLSAPPLQFFSGKLLLPPSSFPSFELPARPSLFYHVVLYLFRAGRGISFLPTIVLHFDFRLLRRLVPFPPFLTPFTTCGTVMENCLVFLRGASSPLSCSDFAGAFVSCETQNKGVTRPINLPLPHNKCCSFLPLFNSDPSRSSERRCEKLRPTPPFLASFPHDLSANGHRLLFLLRPTID